MFILLGKSVARFWWAWLAGWLIVAVAGWKLAPAWESVTRSGEVEFLPADAPSRKADAFYRKTYELAYSASNVAIVFARGDGKLTEADRRFIEKVVLPGIGKVSEEMTRRTNDQTTPIMEVRSPFEEGVGALLTSQDGQATLVVLELSTAFQDPTNVTLLNLLETFFDTCRADSTMPKGLVIAVTGSATAGRDLDVAEADSARSIERWTIIVVVGLLILLYRAPLVAAIPLVTVALAVEVAMSLLSWLALKKIFSPSRDLRVFVTVLVYGGGVDYCLFLVARYREELEHGATPSEAIARSISRVGGAIVASAATVIGGIGMLAFARFGKIHEAGLVIPLALTVALAATLTFAAALLRLAGRYAFWPVRLSTTGEPERHPFWEALGPKLVRHAGMVFVVTTLLLLPFAAVAIWRHNDQNFNPLSDLPHDAPSQVGTRLLEKHFPQGILGPVTVLLENKNVDFTDNSGLALIDELTSRLEARKTEFGLSDIRSLARPLGSTEAATAALSHLRVDKKDADVLVRERAERYYFSTLDPGGNHVTRIDVALRDDPLGKPGITSLVALEKAFSSLLPKGLEGSRVEFVGSAAALRDLGDVKRGDQDLIQVLVSAIVFVLLLLVLHRVVISVYLVVSVLLSYLATLGLTDLVFRFLGGPEFGGLDWKVPIFLFTILVAVGEDYNIFLLTRVKEENENRDPEDAITHALARTGRVISSCGFVMAGTFASLLSSPLSAMRQLGFALSVGVLIDTLVVRPILVPAFMVLLLRLFPGRWGRFMALGAWREEAKTKSA